MRAPLAGTAITTKSCSYIIKLLFLREYFEQVAVVTVCLV